jgi:hypothetical protein
MPGELKLYRDYKLTDVSEYASAAGKKGKGKPKTGARAKGVKRAPHTGRAAKGAGGGSQLAGRGVMETPEDFLLALRQDIAGLQ